MGEGIEGSTCKWRKQKGCVCMLEGRPQGSIVGGTQAYWPSPCLGLVSRPAVVGLVGSGFGVNLMGQVHG